MTFLLANLDRAAAARTYSDEHIERWAAVYLANPALRLTGVPFERFLAQPAAWLRHIADPLRGRALPPTGSGLRRAEAAIAAAERVEGHGENGRLVEKIRHRAYPHRTRSFLPLRDA